MLYFNIPLKNTATDTAMPYFMPDFSKISTQKYGRQYGYAVLFAVF